LLPFEDLENLGISEIVIELLPFEDLDSLENSEISISLYVYVTTMSTAVQEQKLHHSATDSGTFRPCMSR
jgi:hypothetical protein